MALLGILLLALAASAAAHSPSDTILLRPAWPRRQDAPCADVDCPNDVDDSSCYAASLFSALDASPALPTAGPCADYASCLAAAGPGTLTWAAAGTAADCGLAGVELRTYPGNASDTAALLDVLVPEYVVEEGGEVPPDDAVPEAGCAEYSCPGDCNDWPCFQEAFGTPGDLPAACATFNRCLSDRCPAGQTYGYDAGVAIEVDCAGTVPPARLRRYPKAFSAAGDPVAEAGGAGPTKPASGGRRAAGVLPAAVLGGAVAAAACLLSA